MRFYKYFWPKIHPKCDFICIFGQKYTQNAILYAFLAKNNPRMRFYKNFWKKYRSDRSTDPTDPSRKKRGALGGRPPPANNFIYLFLNSLFFYEIILIIKGPGAQNPLIERPRGGGSGWRPFLIHHENLKLPQRNHPPTASCKGILIICIY